MASGRVPTTDRMRVLASASIPCSFPCGARARARRFRSPSPGPVRTSPASFRRIAEQPEVVPVPRPQQRLAAPGEQRLPLRAGSLQLVRAAFPLRHRVQQRQRRPRACRATPFGRPCRPIRDEAPGRNGAPGPWRLVFSRSSPSRSRSSDCRARRARPEPARYTMSVPVVGPVGGHCGADGCAASKGNVSDHIGQRNSDAADVRCCDGYRSRRSLLR